MASSYAITTENQGTRYFNNAACYADLFSYLRFHVRDEKDKVTNLNVKCEALEKHHIHLLVILYKLFRDFKGTSGIVHNNTEEGVLYSKSINLTFQNEDWNAIVFILFTFRLLDEYQGYTSLTGTKQATLFREVIQALPFFKPREGVWFLLLLQSCIPNPDNVDVVAKEQVSVKTSWSKYTLEYVAYNLRPAYYQHYLNSFATSCVSLTAVNTLFRSQTFDGFYLKTQDKCVFKTFQETFIKKVNTGHSKFFSECDKNLIRKPHYDLGKVKVILPRFTDELVRTDDVKEQFKIQCPQVFNYKQVRKQGYLSQPIITP